MLLQTHWAVIIASLVLLGLYLSNFIYDYKVPQYITRKIGHLFGGIGYLLSVLVFPDPLWAVSLSLSFTVMLAVARVLDPSTFRGVGGSSRKQAFAEVWFPMAGTISLVVGWGLLDNKWLALVPILYMAFGDALTGLIRAKVYNREVKGNWGSVGMFLTCLLVGTLFTPYWIAVVGAVTATVAEKYSKAGRVIDDNWTIVLSSLVVMVTLWILIPR